MRMQTQAVSQVLQDPFTSTPRWDNPTGPYRQARADFINAVTNATDLTPAQRQVFLDADRKRTRQLKTLMHYFYGVPLPAGFDTDGVDFPMDW